MVGERPFLCSPQPSRSSPHACVPRRARACPHMYFLVQHHVQLDPTVMVALMSMLVLEGWQFRLDPSTSILGSIEQQLDRRSSMLGLLLSFAR